jgi:hypothetical protein
MRLDTTAQTLAARRLYGRIAGGAYLAIVLAAFVYGGLVESELIVPGDDAVTAANILAHPLRFRLGIVLVLVIYVSVVVASWALFVVLRNVHENLALLALLFRMAEAILGAATILLSFAVWYLLSAEGSAAAATPDQLHALAGSLLDARTAGLDLVLVFIGVGATIFCYLLFKSKLVPRPLAGWGIFTYSSMLVLALISILVPDHPLMLETVLYSAGGAFELIFGLWLLVKGTE